MEPRKCEYCGDEYTPHKSNQRFDTRECLTRWHNEQRKADSYGEWDTVPVEASPVEN